MSHALEDVDTEKRTSTVPMISQAQNEEITTPPGVPSISKARAWLIISTCTFAMIVNVSPHPQPNLISLTYSPYSLAVIQRNKHNDSPPHNRFPALNTRNEAPMACISLLTWIGVPATFLWEAGRSVWKEEGIFVWVREYVGIFSWVGICKWYVDLHRFTFTCYSGPLQMKSRWMS